jgi:hypothetical protein
MSCTCAIIAVLVCSLTNQQRARMYSARGKLGLPSMHSADQNTRIRESNEWAARQLGKFK